MSDQACGIVIVLVATAIIFVCLLSIGHSIGKDEGYQEAAGDSMKADMPRRWRRALIDAKAKRDKENVE